MKVTLQKVTCGKVLINGEIKASIEKGISLLVGFGYGDTEKDVDYMVNKCLNLRIFEDKNKNKTWELSVKSLNLEILVISQFTLYSKLKGNKLDFHKAKGTEEAEAMYNLFIKKMRDNYEPELVKDGLFGLYREVVLNIDGPVTINLES